MEVKDKRSGSGKKEARPTPKVVNLEVMYDGGRKQAQVVIMFPDVDPDALDGHEILLNAAHGLAQQIDFAGRHAITNADAVAKRAIEMMQRIEQAQHGETQEEPQHVEAELQRVAEIESTTPTLDALAPTPVEDKPVVIEKGPWA